MKVARSIFHLSFQLTGTKLFLSGSFRREGRKATCVNMCKHVPRAPKVSLRSGWFGKPKYSPVGEVQHVTHAGILVTQSEQKDREANPGGSRLCNDGGTNDVPFCTGAGNKKGMFLSNGVLSFVAPAMFQSWTVCTMLYYRGFILNAPRIQQEERRTSSFALPFSHHF